MPWVLDVVSSLCNSATWLGHSSVRGGTIVREDMTSESADLESERIAVCEMVLGVRMQL